VPLTEAPYRFRGPWRDGIRVGAAACGCADGPTSGPPKSQSCCNNPRLSSRAVRLYARAFDGRARRPRRL